ncbi:MAG TPA: glycosyltransferase family 2 protein, partial [Chloroflexia bacterium]|nr:glycosyltransferase family 2 protein [Chloroflexia bacterium]
MRRARTRSPVRHSLGSALVRDTLLINGITTAVALGLWRNLRADDAVRPVAWPTGRPAPHVSVIVPMRDESAHVDGVIGGLLAQHYAAFEIIAVDDGSTDGTGTGLRRWAAADTRVRVVTGTPPPAGWTGKNWALQQGLEATAATAAWVLTLDADMRVTPLTLASAVIHAEQVGADLLTLIPGLELESFWARVLVPQAGELYGVLVGTLGQINNPRSRVAAANGQFMLIRHAVYQAFGGQAAVRGEVAEDWALAGRLKAAGYRLHMAPGQAIL